MKSTGRILRWTEHLVLIILLLLLLASAVPRSAPTGRIASVPSTVNADMATVEPNELSDGLVDLLPDIGAIYRNALAYPLIHARGDIQDPDLLEFYDGYLKAIGFAPE